MNSKSFWTKGKIIGALLSVVVAASVIVLVVYLNNNNRNEASGMYLPSRRHSCPKGGCNTKKNKHLNSNDQSLHRSNKSGESPKSPKSHKSHKSHKDHKDHKDHKHRHGSKHSNKQNMGHNDDDSKETHVQIGKKLFKLTRKELDMLKEARTDYERVMALRSEIREALVNKHVKAQKNIEQNAHPVIQQTPTDKEKLKNKSMSRRRPSEKSLYGPEREEEDGAMSKLDSEESRRLDKEAKNQDQLRERLLNDGNPTKYSKMLSHIRFSGDCGDEAAKHLGDVGSVVDYPEMTNRDFMDLYKEPWGERVIPRGSKDYISEHSEQAIRAYEGTAHKYTSEAMRQFYKQAVTEDALGPVPESVYFDTNTTNI